MKRSAFLSLTLHLALLALFFWIARKPSTPEKPPTEPNVIILEEGPKGKSSRGLPPSSATTGGGRSRETEPAPKPPLNLGLTPKPPGTSGRDGKTDSGIPGGKAGGGAPDGYETANQMGLEQEGKLYPFFDALWRKVDATVTYPNDFAQQRIQGKVTVQLVVDRRGVFTGEIRSVNGPEPMLNTFALATLTHALRNPLPQKQWMNLKNPLSPERMLLVFQFDFHTFGPGEIPRKELVSHLKNILSFRRDSYVDPLLNQKIEKFFTRYMPPIIPIPGGFYIDFIRAYQYFSNVLSPTPDEDELRARRLQAKKEVWESVIQKAPQATASPQP